LRKFLTLIRVNSQNLCSPFSGPDGEIGERGSIGEKGSIGKSGLKGDKGDMGFVGFNGGEGIPFFRMSLRIMDFFIRTLL